MRSGAAGGSATTSLTRLHRIIAACDAFEAALLAGRPAVIEDHLGAAPEADRPRLLRELLALELEHRRARGEAPTRDEYATRLPGYASVITEAFGPHDGDPGVTAMIRDGRE